MSVNQRDPDRPGCFSCGSDLLRGAVLAFHTPAAEEGGVSVLRFKATPEGGLELSCVTAGPAHLSLFFFLTKHSDLALVI